LIEGGNRTQYGKHGPQIGDGQATLGSEKQQQPKIAAITQNLARDDVVKQKLRKLLLVLGQ
jgi:hypothetical protein